jgi:hypothetical protein
VEVPAIKIILFSPDSCMASAADTPSANSSSSFSHAITSFAQFKLLAGASVSRHRLSHHPVAETMRGMMIEGGVMAEVADSGAMKEYKPRGRHPNKRLTAIAAKRLGLGR